MDARHAGMECETYECTGNGGIIIMVGNALAEIIVPQPATDVYSDGRITYFNLKLCHFNVSPPDC